MRMFGKLGVAVAVFAGAALMPATSEAVLILSPATPADCTSNETSAALEGGLVESCFGVSDIDLLYRANVGGGEAGSFADSYGTVFANSPDDPQEGTITYDGLPDPSIDCAAIGGCFLVVKDGNQVPAMYLFDISGWNGTETIQLNGFWPNQGAISHVSIWGGEGDGDGGGDTVVPEPASLLLLGMGALVAGRRARRRFAA
jgi:hypothetical protein